MNERSCFQHLYLKYQNDRAGIVRVHATWCEIHPELSCTIKRNLRDQTASVVKEFNYLYDDKLATGINVRNQQVPCTGQFLSTEYASITWSARNPSEVFIILVTNDSNCFLKNTEV